VAAISTLLLGLSLILHESSLALAFQGAVASVQAASLLAYLRTLRSTRKVSRHPSATFTQALAPIYAAAQAFYRLVLASEVMNPGAALAWVEKWGVS
jgi:hypothetical protein